MKVTHNSPDRLIVSETPWFVAIATFVFVMAWAVPGVLLLFMGDWVGVVMAALGMGMGIAAMGLFAEHLQLVLDTRTQTATIRSRTIFRKRETVLPLGDVIRATGEATLSGSVANPHRRKQKVGRPALVLDDGSGNGQALHPVTETYSNSGGAKIMIDAVNDWLQDLRGT